METTKYFYVLQYKHVAPAFSCFRNSMEELLEAVEHSCRQYEKTTRLTLYSTDGDFPPRELQTLWDNIV